MKVRERLWAPLTSSIHVRIILYWALLLLIIALFERKEEDLSNVIIKVAPKVESKVLVLAPPQKREILASSVRKEKRKKRRTSSQTQIVGKIDINRATATQLVTIKGIGPVLANRIILYREENGFYKNVESLTAVKGIGKKRVAKLQQYVTVKK